VDIKDTEIIIFFLHQAILTAAMEGSSSQMCIRQGGCWQW